MALSSSSHRKNLDLNPTNPNYCKQEGKKGFKKKNPKYHLIRIISSSKHI